MRIVIAIDGDVILNPAGGIPIEQKKMIDKKCKEITEIMQKGYDVIRTHGNVPQIGNVAPQLNAKDLAISR